MSTENSGFFRLKTGRQEAFAGGVLGQFLIHPIKIGASDDVFVPFEPQRTLQPLAGGQVIAVWT